VELHLEPLETLVRSGLVAKIGRDMIFDDLEDAVAAFSASPDKVPSEQRTRTAG
jgi:sulfate permease, SulP family